MRHVTVLIVVLVAIVIGVVFVMLVPSRERVAPALPWVAGAEAPTPGETAPLPPFARETVEQPAPASTAADEQELTGTVVVLDAEDGSHADEDGTFRLRMVRGDAEPTFVEVPIHVGKWQAQVPAGVKLDIYDLVLRGRLTVIDGELADLDLPPDRHLDIRARWLPTTTLHVIDADTSSELDHVSVLADPGYSWGKPFELPDPQCEEWLRDVRSPIELRARTDEWPASLWIQAEGHGWANLEVDYAKGGEYRATLKPMLSLGSLQVTVLRFDLAAGIIDQLKNTHHDAEASVTLYRPEAADAYEPRAKAIVRDAGPVLLEGLEPGRCALRVAIIDREGDRTYAVLAENVCLVRAGERTPITLELRADPNAEIPGVPVRCRGTLSLPSGWSLEGVTLAFDGKAALALDEMQPVPGHDRLYRWDLETVDPGAHEFEVLGYRESIDLEGQEIAIVVPEPANLTLRLVDAETGSAIDTNDLTCNRSPPNGKDESGRFVWRVPASPQELMVWDKRYRWPNTTLELHPGDNDAKVALDRACGFNVRFRNTEQPPRDVANLEVEKLDGGTGQFEGSGWEAAGPWFQVHPPGRYRITLSFRGYRPCPPFEVTLVRGEFTDVELDPGR